MNHMRFRIDSIGSRITYPLRDIFRVWRLKIAIFALCILTVHPNGITSNSINAIHTSLKSSPTFNAWNAIPSQTTRGVFIRLAFVAYQICEITRNSEKMPTPGSSRTSKIIDLGANRKRICNFLLVNNNDYGRISYLFRDIDALSSTNSLFPNRTLV